MKRLQFKTNVSDKLFSIGIPGLGSDLTKQQRFLEFVTSFRSLLLHLMVLLLPVSLFFFSEQRSVGQESSLFIFLLLALVVIFAIYAIEIVFAAKSHIADPTGSLIVLVFGLLVTTASALLVFSNYEATANTFGVVSETSVKGVAGLAVIIGMSLYYLLQLQAIQEKKKMGIVQSFLLGMLLVPFALLIDQTLSFSNQNVLVGTLSVPFLFLGIVLWKQFVLKLLGLAGIVIIAQYYIDHTFISSVETVTIVSVSFVSMIFSYVLFSFQSEAITSFLKSIRSRFNAILDAINSGNVSINRLIDFIARIIILPLLLTFPATLFVIVLFIIDQSDRFEIFKTIVDFYGNIFSNINGEFITVLTGIGASQASAALPLFGNVLLSNGLFGLVAYLILFGFGAFIAIKNIIRTEDSNKRLLFTVVQSFVLLFVPVISIFLYPGFFLLILWWFCFATALPIPKKQKILLALNITYRFAGINERVLKILRVVLTLTLIVISYILIYTVIDTVGVIL